MGSVGNPDGNAAFTIWSPDGRYLIDDINLLVFYKPPASIIPDVQALSKLKLRHNRLNISWQVR